MSDAETAAKPATGYVRAKLLARRAKLQAERTAPAGIGPTTEQMPTHHQGPRRAYVRPADAIRWLHPSDHRGWVGDRAVYLAQHVGGDICAGTARQWISGCWPMPAWAKERLADLVALEAAAGLTIAAELRASAAEDRTRERAAPAFMRVGPDGTNRQGRGKRAKIIRPDDAADKNRA